MSFIKQKSLEGHAGAIYAATFDGRFLYTGSADKFVARWDLEKGIQDNFSIKFEQSIYAVESISDKFLIVGLANGDVHIFDLIERKEIHYFKQHVKAIFSIAYNSNKEQLYIADADGNLSIWSVPDFKLMIYLPLDAGKIRNIAVNESGELFALSCQDETIRVFESKGLNEIVTLNAHNSGSTAVIFDQNNPTQLITGGKDARIKLWNWQKEEELLNIPAHNYAVYDLISMNNRKNYISCSRDKTIKVWDADLNFLKRLDFKEGGHRHSVNRLVKISEKEFVSISDDAKIIVWESEGLI